MALSHATIVRFLEDTMKQTDQSLLEQMRITDFAIASRKELLALTKADEHILQTARPFVEKKIGALVDQFYDMQTSIPDIAVLIGDSDTLSRLKIAQHKYILDLFSGCYDMEYVNNRLRIGLVHKRIGVEPQLYLAAVHTLRQLLRELIYQDIHDVVEQRAITAALQKLLMFDVSLVFDTYIRSMVSEIEISKSKLESYARALEEKVMERTVQLEVLSKTDPLTGLLNVRHLNETLIRCIRSAQRRRESVVFAYMDLNDFKIINDTQGHQYGDEILKIVANALKTVSRADDHCFRYGGDEFCVIMENCTLADAHSWEERLQAFIQEQAAGLTVSIGLAQSGPQEYHSADEMIRRADEMMYQTKKRMKSTRNPALPSP